jgi:outer membrane protein assembly factor BamB
MKPIVYITDCVTRLGRIGIVLAVAAGFRPASADVDPLDWPNWRGPEQNGVSREVDLIDRWSPVGGPDGRLLWKEARLAGRSSPIVMRGRLYMTVRDQPHTAFDAEKVVCADAATGQVLWENRFNVYLSDVPAERVGWSSCVGDPETGDVYVLGVCGFFQCLDGETGQAKWSRSLSEEFGLISTYGGRTAAPIVFEDLVLVDSVIVGWGDTPQWGNLAKPAHRFLAFDKRSGRLVWQAGTGISPPGTSYSTAVMTVLSGQAAMVFGSSDGAVWALQPRTGKPIWHFDLSRAPLNVSPLVVGETVYTGHCEENITGNRMGGLVAIDGSGRGDLTGKELWRLEEVMISRTSPQMFDGKLLTVDMSAKLRMFDPASGKLLSQTALGGTMFSSPLQADGKIYLVTESRNWLILGPGERPKILSRARMPQGESNTASPVVSHGRIYVATNGHLYCFGDTRVEPRAEPRPAPSKETPVEQDKTPADVQVVPADLLLYPGQQVRLETRIYNARGQRLRDVRGSFAVEGPGSVSAEGVYQAPRDVDHSVARVSYQVGELSGSSRVRIVPPLPWRFDFEHLDDLPLTWIGGRVRYVIRDVDGQRVAVKRDLIPTRPGQTTKLGTRSRLFMGHTDLAGYTIQADFQGQIKDGKLPDMGLIAQRYTLDLQGASQALQIRSWDTEVRMAQTMPFAWQPGVWYTMKFSSINDGAMTRLRAKVWPREQAEPKDWLLEAEDPSPNLQGSPGLFGNTKDAEFYVDNITVVPNPSKE